MNIVRTLTLCPDAKMLGEFERVLGAHKSFLITRTLNEYPDADALAHVLRTFAPAIVFISMEQPAVAEAIAASIHSISRGTHVVALSSDFNTELLYASVRGGMREFLTRPFDPKVIASTLNRLISLLLDCPPAIQHSRNVFGFVSAKPGSGATTIALHTSIELARQTGVKTLLLDMDRRASMLAFLLKLPNRFGITDAAEYHAELDEDIWGRMVTRVGGVDCVTAGKVSCQDKLVHGNLMSFLNYAQRNYDLVCLDLPSGLDSQLPIYLSECTSVFLVSTPEAGPLYMANRTLDCFNGLLLSERTKLVLNRVVQGSVLDRCVEQIIKEPVFARIPNHYSDLQRAIQDGHALDRRTKYGRSIQHLVRKCLGIPEPKQPGIVESLMQRLVGRTGTTQVASEPPKLVLAPSRPPIALEPKPETALQLYQ